MWHLCSVIWRPAAFPTSNSLVGSGGGAERDEKMAYTRLGVIVPGSHVIG